jgi:hypothetical protein
MTEYHGDVSRGPPVPWTEEETNFLLANWATMSASQIGKQLGRSRRSVIGRKVRLSGRDMPVLGDTTRTQRMIERKAPWTPGDPIPDHLKLENFPYLGGNDDGNDDGEEDTETLPELRQPAHGGEGDGAMG